MSLIEANQSIGNYRVVRRIGTGGMGEVWEAEHNQIGSRVALKVLLAKYSHEPEVARRFLNEARAVNLVSHPSLVRIFDFGILPNGSCYIAMEFLEGELLRRRIELNGRLGADALRIARQTASALAAAHEKGIIHRDLKPDNLILIKDPETAGGERVKILDFGIAKMVRQPSPHETAPAQTSADSFMGTPQYMSPEQCRGAGNVEEKSDVYSLGIILFEMLSGHLPFPLNTPVGELIAMHLYGQPPRLSELDPTITEDVSDVVARMLAKQPALRPSMNEVAQQLEELGAPQATGQVRLVSWGPENRVPIVPSSSTLGSSAGQRNRRPSVASRARAPLAIAMGVALLGGGGGLLVRHYVATSRPPGPEVHLRTPPTKSEPPVNTAPEQPKPVSPPPVNPAPPVAPRQVRWHIESEPPGAEIVDLESKKVVGLTPWEYERDASDQRGRFRLQLQGYQDKEVSIDGGRDSRTSVALRKSSRTKAPTTSVGNIDEDGSYLLLDNQQRPSSHRTDRDQAH